MQDQNNSNPNQTSDINYDPNQDIDISSIESMIIDTSKGDIVDTSKFSASKVYRLKCLDCNFMYEGQNFIEICPRCNSKNLDDCE